MPIFFDDGADVVDCGSDASLDNIWDGGGTIMAWIFLNSFGSGPDFGRIVDKTDTNAIDNGWSLLVNDNTLVSTIGLVVEFTGGQQSWSAPSNSISTGQWYHVAITYDSDATANDPIIYIDGVSVTVSQAETATGTRTSDAAQQWLVGNSATRERGFDGEIEDVITHDRILLASEVSDVFEAQVVPIDYVSRWKMFGVAGGGDWVRFDSVELDTGNTIDVPIPGGVEGELMMVVAGAAGDFPNHSGEAADYATPSGWTLRNSTQDTAATALSRPSFFVFIKTATAADSAPFNLTLTQSFPSAPTTSITTKVAISARFPLTIDTSPDVSYGISIATTGTPSSLGVTLSGAGVAVWALTRDEDGGPTGPGADIYPPGTIGLNSFAEISTNNNGMTMALAIESVASGATGTRTWNPDGGAMENISGSDAYLGVLDATPVKDEGANANHGAVGGSPRYTESVRTLTRRRRIT